MEKREEKREERKQMARRPIAEAAPVELSILMSAHYTNNAAANDFSSAQTGAWMRVP